jgi:hypothetical protein
MMRRLLKTNLLPKYTQIIRNIRQQRKCCNKFNNDSNKTQIFIETELDKQTKLLDKMRTDVAVISTITFINFVYSIVKFFSG